MAKLTGPALNISTRGAIGHDVIYSATRGGSIGKSYARPANPSTPAQQASRKVFHNLSALTRSAPATWRAVLEEQARYAKQPIHNALVKWNMAAWKAAASDYPLIAARAHNLPPGLSTLATSATSGDIAATFANPLLTGALVSPRTQYLLLPDQNPTAEDIAVAVSALHVGLPTTVHLAPPLPSTLYQLVAFASGVDARGRPAWTDSVAVHITSAPLHYPTTILTASTNVASSHGSDYARVAYNTITEDDNGWSGIAGNTINPNAPGTYRITASFTLWAPFGAVTALCAVHLQNGSTHTHNFSVSSSLISDQTLTVNLSGNLIGTSGTVQIYPEVWNQGAASFVYVKTGSYIKVEKIA